MNERILTFPVERDHTLKKRVAVYARVSTISSEQETSYDLQINELIKLVDSNPSYQLICVFADKESGQSSNRKAFMQLIELVRAGAVNLIITKAISRFGRNLVDVVSLIREFKSCGCEIYFEKENLWTYDAKIELTLNILSAVAEEESRQISSNVAWSFTKKMRVGGNMTNKIYGYSIAGDTYTIIPKQAAIVRQIFDWYIAGVSYVSMIDRLEQMKVASPSGNSKWSHTTLEGVLVNEKYIGDMLLRKFRHGRPRSSFAANHKGQVEQFYVKNHHEPIISKAVFDEAQKLRKSQRVYYNREKGSSRTPYTGYFFSKDLSRYFYYVLERPKGRYEIPTLKAVNGRERRMFRFKDIENGAVLAANRLIDNETYLLNRLAEIMPTAIKEKQNMLKILYAELPNLSIQNKLEQYSFISNVLVSLAKLNNLGNYMRGVLKSARKLLNEFSMETLKEIFSSFIIAGYDIYLIINSCDKDQKEIPQSAFEFDSFELPIIHLYKKVILRFHLLFDTGSISQS